MATAVQSAIINRGRWRPLVFAAAFLLTNAVLLLGVDFSLWRGADDEGDDVLRALRRHQPAVLGRRVRDVNLLDDNGVGCGGLKSLTSAQLVASGWTKAVFRGELEEGGAEVAVKKVNLNGHDMVTCVDKQENGVGACYKKAAAKILKEILLLKQLTHPNVLQVLGYCIPNGEPELADDVVAGAGIALITQLGQTLDIIRLLQSSWEDRLRLTLGVSKIVYHLAHSPLGSLVMNDFRRQQFVLVDGELKLSDVDDVEFEEPLCAADDDCTIRHQPAELTLRVECTRGRCHGYNEKQNIYNAGRHFVTFLLPHGAPASLRPLVDDVVAAYANVSWDSRRILTAVEHIHQLFVSGKYLRPGYRDVMKGYRVAYESDLPGLYDYRCQLTLSGTGCTMSVFDEAEAADICDHDTDCRAFVMTSQTSWTGRRMVHFKSNVSLPVEAKQTTLFVKLS